MSDQKKTNVTPKNNGYQPSPGAQRGYQTNPNGQFGYQPLRGPGSVSKPPSPPSTGSNASKPNSKSE